MSRWLATLALLLVLPPVPAQAQPACRFVLGFADLRDKVGAAKVGACLEDERFNDENGNAEQRTSDGLMVWRKADNFTAFTDGGTSWIAGPNGVQSRPNGERFAWEKDPVSRPLATSSTVTAPAEQPTIVAAVQASAPPSSATSAPQPATSTPQPTATRPTVVRPTNTPDPTPTARPRRTPTPSGAGFAPPTDTLEAVALLKVTGDTALIERRFGGRYLIELGIGCLGAGRYEGKVVYVDSPGLFAGIGSSLILPSNDGSCRIWDSKSVR